MKEEYVQSEESDFSEFSFIDPDDHKASENDGGTDCRLDDFDFEVPLEYSEDTYPQYEPATQGILYSYIQHYYY